MKKIWLAVSSVVAILVLFLAVWLPGQYVVPVLVYHSIDAARTERDRANTVSPASFERQMAFIKQNGYRALTVDEYVSMIRAGGKFPPKSVLISFDDGLLDNYTYAYPVLSKYGIPAVMFVPSSDVGKREGRWQVPQMGLDQLREISTHGIMIGSHTASHTYLPEVSMEMARREIIDSKASLEKMIGRPVEYLAYPTGGFNEEIKAMVREAGYKAAFTTNRGYDRHNQDLYELKRIRPKDSDGALVMWVKLSGYYNLIRNSKNPE